MPCTATTTTTKTTGIRKTITTAIIKTYAPNLLVICDAICKTIVSKRLPGVELLDMTSKGINLDNYFRKPVIMCSFILL